MAFQIIRNDIVKVEADAIVNTANPLVNVGAGVDESIYRAAGWEELLAERKKIGEMEPGEVAHTPAFALNAKYIIHAIGPAWRGGDYGECETVAKCYRKSLELADELGCESIAFPLIATGTYGFPKDEALRIAVTEISTFLLSHEMEVLLVVYDRESFEVSGKLFDDIKAYVEDEEANYVPYRRRRRRLIEYLQRPEPEDMVASVLPEEDASEFPDENVSEFPDEDVSVSSEEDVLEFPEENVSTFTNENVLEFQDEDALGIKECIEVPDEDLDESDEAEILSDATVLPDEDVNVNYVEMEALKELRKAFSVSSASKGKPLSERLAHLDKTFQEYLFMLIDRKGMKDSEVYKKANIDRKHFSKIRSNVDYKPTKKTALALAIALELNIDQTRDLLGRAGLAFSGSSPFDRIIEYCIETGEYNIHEINCILFEYDQQLLGA